LLIADEVVEIVVEGGATQVNVVAPDAVNVTALPGQTEGLEAPAVSDKLAPITTLAVAEAVQPFAEPTTVKFVLAAGELVMTDVVAAVFQV